MADIKHLKHTAFASADDREELEGAAYGKVDVQIRRTKQAACLKGDVLINWAGYMNRPPNAARATLPRDSSVDPRSSPTKLNQKLPPAL